MAHRILLKTTIAPFDDDWCSARFSLLRAHLAGLNPEARRDVEASVSSIARWLLPA
jgi:hypothetical protein